MSSVYGNELPSDLGYTGEERRQPERIEPEHGIVIAATLENIYRELRRIRSMTREYGRQFVRQDGGAATGAGLFTCLFEGPKSGNEWYLERVTISASGASAAGTVAIYASKDIDESRLLDFLPALAGAAGPSRGHLDGNGTPYFVYGGAPVLVAVAGVVAAAQVQVQVQGREVAAGYDPAMHPQDI